MADEHVVRMGELAVSRTAGDVLACVGLGSCIGLLLIDRSSGVAALAHVMLPETPATVTAPPAPAKYADSGVPAVIQAAVAAGARATRLEAALVGGASMFAASGAGQEIGARNHEAVITALAAARVPVLTALTGGSRGRTIRARLQGPAAVPDVTVREAGGQNVPLPLDRALALA